MNKPKRISSQKQTELPPQKKTKNRQKRKKHKTMKYSAFLVLHKNKEFKTIRQTIPMKNELAELGIENCLQKKKRQEQSNLQSVRNNRSLN